MDTAVHSYECDDVLAGNVGGKSLTPPPFFFKRTPCGSAHPRTRYVSRFVGNGTPLISAKEQCVFAKGAGTCAICMHSQLLATGD